jgi:hypothetical protein
MTEDRVWVEIKDSLVNINEALEGDLDAEPCQNEGCPRTNSVSFNYILRDSSKLDTMTGLAPKVKQAARLCKICLKAIKKELEELEAKDSDY